MAVFDNNYGCHMLILAHTRVYIELVVYIRKPRHRLNTWHILSVERKHFIRAVSRWYVCHLAVIRRPNYDSECQHITCVCNSTPWLIMAVRWKGWCSRIWKDGVVIEWHWSMLCMSQYHKIEYQYKINQVLIQSYNINFVPNGV